MKTFEGILKTVRASESNLLEEGKNWEFWSAVYQTPASPVTAYYLYLKYNCSADTANTSDICRIKKHYEQQGYELIYTPKSKLSDFKNLNKEFGAKKASSSADFLRRVLISSMEVREIDAEEWFIEPDIKVNNHNEKAQSYLVQWFQGKEGNGKNVSVLLADGGSGKTTLARSIAAEVKSNFNSQCIPLLIEAEHWRDQLQSNVTIPNVWDIALNRCLSSPARIVSNQTAFNVLVREGLIWVIFDGFDELCLHQGFAHSPVEVIESFISDLVGEDDSPSNARILLTSRKNYWDSYRDQLPLESINELLLLGFSNTQKTQYFTNRLEKTDKINLAQRYSSEIGGRLYNGSRESQVNRERLEGTPFILGLIAAAVEDDDNINPYGADPLEDLLISVCRRENKRQRLDIDEKKQMELFEELFRECSGRIQSEQLKEYIEIICNISDLGVIERFHNHFFIRKCNDEEGGYAPRYEILRTYFIARFLSVQLVDVNQRGSWRNEVARTLAESSSGKTAVIDWLLTQLKSQTSEVVEHALSHAFRKIRSPEMLLFREKAGCALFGILQQWIITDDKLERKNIIQRIMSENPSAGIRGGFLCGTVRALNLTGTLIEQSKLNNAEFRNCVFDKASVFKNCTFNGTLSFMNCEGVSNIVFDDCIFSTDAELTISQVTDRKIDSETVKKLAETALERALRRFKGQYGWQSTTYNNRHAGISPNNPFKDSVWEVLKQQGIVETHRISGVSNGGLNLIDDPAIKREIQSYFDNGIFGNKLNAVLKQVLELKP